MIVLDLQIYNSGQDNRTRFAFSFRRKENYGVAAVETGGKQQSTGLLHLIGSSPFKLSPP